VTANLMPYLGDTDIEGLYRRLEIDLRQIPIEEHHPDFEQRATVVLEGFSESSGGRYIIHDDGRFGDVWGIVQRLGCEQLYDEWVSGPFRKTTDLKSFQ
jgi:hypothetical protein